VRLAVQGGILLFDPVRTGHRGLDKLSGLSWSAQKRVFIPFHFIPHRPFRPKAEESFSFITRPASQPGEENESFAELILNDAAREPLKNRKRRLCRIGIALHTYADTWAHQFFSGRHSAAENDVENINLYDRRKESYQRPAIENIILDMLPRIGHAEAGFFPDLAFQKWRYHSRHSPIAIERDNTSEFLEAARMMYDRLAAMKKQKPSEPIPWQTLEPDIRDLLSVGPGSAVTTLDQLTAESYRRYHMSELDARCKRWQDKFDHLFRPYPSDDVYSFDRRRWRQLALKGDTDWDDWAREQWGEIMPMELRPRFWDSLWVHFHRAALRQRHLVLENMP
jgi:hypothetical protein